MASEFFGRQRECRFYTAGCGNKMAVSVTGPRAVNELGGPVIPGTYIYVIHHIVILHMVTCNLLHVTLHLYFCDHLLTPN